ncbi:NTP transferase domain-containing protein [Candidatus Gottesmanbacteria bacterium]|nr:NTP transferase domain-containing protein [Candidatus Gottesmanbacteria bacterium]
MSRELIAVVLAGGAGSRFWPITTNKLLLPFLGRRFIDFSVADVMPKEITRMVIITSTENKETIDSMHFGVPTVTVLQHRPMGMADALLSASSELENARLLVIIADDLLDRKILKSVAGYADKKEIYGAIPGWKTPSYFPGGYIMTVGDRIVNIVEKPGEGKEPSNFVAVSGHYIADSNALLKEIRAAQSTADDVYERAVSVLMRREQFCMVPYSGNFISLKYPWDVLSAMDYLLKSRLRPHRGKNVSIRDSVIIEGDVYIDDGVQIFEHTKIVGPCYIGKNSIIGNNNLIRHSHIGENCVSGFNTDITRSYIGNNCWFHSNYIGDSFLEGNISMGSGTVLANLKLDEAGIGSQVKDVRIETGLNRLGAVIGQGVRLGVNISVMPGVKIGSGSFVGAGVILDKDIPEHSFCKATAGYTIGKNNISVAPRSANQFKY